VAAVNRVGHEGAKGGGIEFFGASFICDPYGRMIAEASRGKSEVLVAEVDPRVVETARQHWPFLRDRRIDAYGAITERSLEKK
jgi:N-carbamoylputrescine amidase